MHTSSLIPQTCLLFLSLFTELAYSDCLASDVGSTVNQGCQEAACGAAPAPSGTGVTVLGTKKSASGKRAVWDPIYRNNVTWPSNDYSYQVSPYYKPAAVLRECSGSIVTSFDTIHANLNGRGQTWVSQRNSSCNESSCANAPIRLFSGGGAVSTILQADIPFPGGILHIVDKLLTTPVKLSATLKTLTPTAFTKLINAFIAYDNVASSTFFIPSDAALAASCSYTLAPGEARTLMNAQSVRDFVAYSPSLVDGAFFKAGNGEDITITVATDGSKYANGIKIVQQDIIVENGVVHIIDGLFSSPSTSCAGPPPSKTVTVVSTIYQQSTVYQVGPTVTLGPTTTVYPTPGSCVPSTMTFYQGQTACPSPTTLTETLTPTTCANGPAGTTIVTSCSNLGASCPPPGVITTTATYCPLTGSSCPPSGVVTTTTTTTLTPAGSACPSVPPPTITTTTTTYTTGGPPGVNTTITSTSYAPPITQYITTSICAPENLGPPPSSTSTYKTEDCDENGVPYGTGNPRPIISYMWQGIGGAGGSTSTPPPSSPPAPASPTVLTGPPAYGSLPPGTYSKTW